MKIQSPTVHDFIVDRRGIARYRGRAFPVSLGKNGITITKREGDGATPAGEYSIEWWYIRPDRVQNPPSSALELRTIKMTSGWSDEPGDTAYNQPISRPHQHRHERLYRPRSLYDVIGVLSFNRNPIEPGKGSAIFLHIWRQPRYPTEGCIAMDRRHLLLLLETWTRRSRIIIEG